MTSAVATLTLPARSDVLDDVREGLTRPQKELPPKYFYDRRGSELFEEITRLPEYYLTRAERRLLSTLMPERMRTLRSASLVELGAGSGEKTRIILDAMVGSGSAESYVPIDVSAEFLDDTARRFRGWFPELAVTPVVADITTAIEFPRSTPRPILFALLGSTIGNFDPASAVALFRRVRSVMRAGDRFLLGADLRKSVRKIERAYNDAAGVTAEFNRNMLRVINRSLGADFVPERFDHRAVYDSVHHRIEMHLVARSAHAVRIPGLGLVPFRAGESIRTEICCKYDRTTIASMLADAGLKLDYWRVDAEDRYAICTAAPAWGWTA
jgi:L-histidine N-alpha-methyltransferase